MIVRHLTSQGLWDLRPSDSKAVVQIRVEEIAEFVDHRILSQFEHFREFHHEQRQSATRAIFVGLNPPYRVADELQVAVQHTLVHAGKIVIANDFMRPAPSQEERPKPATKAFAATPANLLNALWNKYVSVATAAVVEPGLGRGGASWWKPKPTLKPASRSAPWNQPGCVPAVRMDEIDRPRPGQALSPNMPLRCPPCPFADLHESHWYELSRALNKAPRHDRECPVEYPAYAWLNDIFYVLG